MRLLVTLTLCATLSAADYYVSPSGNDSNAGTSSSAPWKTVGKVNGRSFAAGDRVLFQGGQTFTDAGLSFAADDTGSAANPITVGSYGTGRATLQPPATADGISVYNTAGLYLRDLILVGPGATASDTNQKRGVFAYCDLASGAKLGGLRLENLDISSFYEGVLIGAWHASFSGFQDALITGCLVHDNLANGIITYGYSPNSATQQSHANLGIVGCEVTRNYGDPTLSNPSAQHSGSGIIISGTRGGLVDRCYAHHNGGSAGDNAGGGPGGIWCYATDGVIIQRCLVHDQKTTTGAMDGVGFDIDGGSTNCIVQYCYSYNNEGSGYLIAEYSGATPLQNAIFRYNISWRDGRRLANNMASGIHFWSGENLASECQDIRVYNNLVYTENATGGPCVRYQSGPMAGIRLWNNIFVVQGAEKFVDIGSNTGYFTAQGNLYWAVDSLYTGGWKWGATTYTSLTAWRLAAGTPETLSGSPVGLQADPLVASLVAGAQPTSVAAMEAMTTFKLLAGSPAINAGQDLRTATFGSLNVGSRDFFAAAIPVGAFDIGPQETVAVVAPGSLQLGSATYSQSEGNTGTATVTITANRTGGSGGAVSMSYATSNGTASAGSDYTAVSGTLFWAAGDTAAKTFAVTIAGDTAYEANETVMLTLSGATGGSTLGTPATAVLTIVNDDALPTYAVTYSANGATGGTIPGAQIKTQGTALTLATNSGNLVRVGYTFAGWNTAADGSGTSHAPGAIYSTDAAVTLYATWTVSDFAVQGGFETPAQSAGGFTYSPSGSAWSFANGGGISRNGSGFTHLNPAAPEGVQVAFLQGWGSAQQSAVWPAGSYQITWKAAQRSGNSQNAMLSIDGSPLLTFQPGGSAWQSYSSSIFTLSAGSHTIRFAGINSAGGDNTLLLDDVQVESGFQEGGFEAPAQSAGGFTYAPSGSAWSFANGGGISRNGSGFTHLNPAAPEGVQVAFLQGSGTTQQAAVWPAGSYQVTWKAAQRSGNSQNAMLSIDGSPLLTFQPGGSAWQSYSSSIFTLNAGSHTIRFAGINGAGGDNTLLLDDVQVVEAGFQEGGFETPAQSAGGFTYAPSGSAWTFANGGGISRNASGFTYYNPSAPEGVQVAFLQGWGSAQQSAVWPAGSYQITWKAAQRSGNSQNVRMVVDGAALLTFQPSGTAWQSFTATIPAFAAGSHTIRFEAINSAGGDNTVFIDDVTFAEILLAPIGPG